LALWARNNRTVIEDARRRFDAARNPGENDILLRDLT
jgi:hypothetical protein